MENTSVNDSLVMKLIEGTVTTAAQYAAVFAVLLLMYFVAMHVA